MEMNPRAHYPRVDDKIITKRFCDAHGIPVPRTYAVIESLGDARHLMDRLAGRGEFVIKPSRGAGGRGVLVVVNVEGETFTTSAGEAIPLTEVKYHIASIAAGLYSLGGRPDRALVEERIRPHAVFEGLAVGGTPDIRIIVCRGKPAMAMVRLPTRASRGRANLHQGAVAAGIDIESGRTMGGVWRNRVVSVHPDTGRPIAGHVVPSWPLILSIAARLGEVLEMGYVGVDIVLDEAVGPVVLEANARPGLSVQIANRWGLLNAVVLSARGGDPPPRDFP
jgi:alpha-L-glutamate ligase-like protein